MRYVAIFALMLLVGCDISGSNADEGPQTTTFELNPAEMQVRNAHHGDETARREYYQTVTVEAMTENVIENGVVLARVEYEDSTYSLPVMLDDALNNESGSIQGELYVEGGIEAAQAYQVRVLCEWFIRPAARDDSLTEVQPITLNIITTSPDEVVGSE